MASYTLSPIGGAGWQFFDNNGVPLAGGKIYTYAAGTTTPQTTWTTPAGTTANANPIILDSAGRPPQEIWLNVAYSYKFSVETSTGILIRTYDNIPGLPQPAIVNDASSISYEQGNTVTAGSFVIGRTYMIASVGSTDFVAIGATANSTGVLFVATGAGSGTGTAYNVQTVEAKLRQTVSVKDFGAVGDGVTDDTTAIQAALDAAAGRALYFSEGVYAINDTLTVSADTTVYGDGYGSVVYQTAREKNIFDLSNNCVVEMLRLKGDGVTSGGINFDKNNGISIVGVRNVNVRGCFIHSFEANGIYCSNSTNVTIADNYIWGNAYSFDSGSDIVLYGTSGSSRRINITKNFCLSNNSQGIYVDAIGTDTDVLVEGNICVTLDPTTWVEIASGSLLRRHGIIIGYNGSSGRYLVSENICRNTRQTGIYYQGGIAPADGVQILGNQCTKNGVNAVPGEESLASGIYVATQGTGDIIANNLVEDFSGDILYGSAGIKISPNTDAQIAANPYTLVANNIVRSSANYGILLTARPRNVEIRGNGVTNSARMDIAVYPSAGLANVHNHTISDNHIQRSNTDYPAIYVDFQASTLPVYIRDNYLLGSDNTVNSFDNVGIIWNTATPNIYVTDNTVVNFRHGVHQSSYLTGRSFSNQFVDRNTFVDCFNGIEIGGTTSAPVLPVQDNVFVNCTNKSGGGSFGFNVVYIAQRFGNNIYFQSASVPTVGTWAVGDRAQQLTPIVGQPKAWMCTVAGNPGTWVSEGNL